MDTDHGSVTQQLLPSTRGPAQVLSSELPGGSGDRHELTQSLATLGQPQVQQLSRLPQPEKRW